MKEVIEHYGMGLLGIISMVLVLTIVFRCYSPNEVIGQMVVNYFIILCGLE